MARNHTVVFADRYTIRSVNCASGKAMQHVDNDIWECTCCDCYLIFNDTDYASVYEVGGNNCSKHKTARTESR